MTIVAKSRNRFESISFTGMCTILYRCISPGFIVCTLKLKTGKNNTLTYHLLLAELEPVSSISANYDCTTQSAVASWSAVFGADSYSATATDENGIQLTCTSQKTSCQITGLSCGQSYVVTVTPISGKCKNILNTTSATFQTGETKLSCTHYHGIFQKMPGIFYQVCFD